MSKRLYCLFFLSFTLLFTTPVYAAEYEIIMQSSLPEQNIGNTILREWVKEIEELSKGRVSIKFVANSAITRIEGTYKGLLAGAVDITMVAPALYPQELPYTNSIAFPCTSLNAIHGTKILWTLLKEQEKIQKELTNIEVLALWATDRDAFIATKSPIINPIDLKGKRFLVMSAGMLGDTINALGGSAVQVSVSDLYIGLQRGMGEVLNLAIPTIRALKLHEVAKYITVFPVATSVSILGMNKEVFQSLPKDIQEIITTTAGEKLSLKIASTLKTIADKDLEKCKAEGIEIITLNPEQNSAMQEVFIENGLKSMRKTYSRTSMSNDFDAWYNIVKETAKITSDTL